MAGTIRNGGPDRTSRLTLNSDGQSHPLLNLASFLTLAIGLLSFALGLFIRADPGSGLAVAVLTVVTGLIALLGGLVAQMMSATREERILLVVGMVAAFVGICLGLAHGGVSG